MGQFAQMIVAAGKVSRAYAERMLAGVTPVMFARRPNIAGKEIITNHPAWCYGHLALYPARIAASLNLDATRLAPPARFEDLFKDGTECLDDAAGTLYPAMEAVTTAFFRAYDGLFEMLTSVDDAALTAPVTDEKAKARFPLVGARVNFLCTSHIMMHMGQVSAWRRCMGLGAA